MNFKKKYGHNCCMNYCVLYSIICMLVLICVLKPKKISLAYFKNIVSPNSFCAYISNLKNCNNATLYNKNNRINKQNKIKMRKNNSANKIGYKYLNIISINKIKSNIKKICYNKKQNYVVKHLKGNMNVFNECLNRIEVLRKFKYVKFRAKNGECLIQTLANSISFKVLYADKFNAISCFNDVKNTVKIYKKEENAFYLLLLNAFMVWLIVLMNECEMVEGQISKGGHVRFSYKTKQFKYIDFVNYGALLFNHNSRSVTQNFSANELEKSVTNALLYFDDLHKKCDIIIKWIKFLLEKRFV